MTRFALLSFVSGLLLAGCTQLTEPAKETTPGANLPQQELYEATITFYQNDRISGVLKAGRIRKFERTSLVLLDSGVVMDFFNEQGLHTSTLWADSGRTDEVRKDMVAMGNVIAQSDSGEMLETTELRWDNTSRQVRSNVRVKLSTPTDTLYGIGFVSDEHLRNWRIDRPYGLTFREQERRIARDSLAVAPQITDSLPGDSL
ncbi:LPS export ABC transporter periplasmic protein LptC [bacterium]|nr:LPS export ABC transporter periplasmic protein LptC [bacterium]MBU1982919.1 LPS export ABC transporter periplasmic protein LptC [bacterium]